MQNKEFCGMAPDGPNSYTHHPNVILTDCSESQRNVWFMNMQIQNFVLDAPHAWTFVCFPHIKAKILILQCEVHPPVFLRHLGTDDYLRKSVLVSHHLRVGVEPFLLGGHSVEPGETVP